MHDGSEEGKRRARQQAAEQAQAAYAHGYEGNAAPDGVQRKSLGVVAKTAIAQASDLELIRPYLRPGADIKEDDLHITTALLAHDQKDRSHERFPEAYLQRFAQTIVGCSLLEGHDYTRRGQGRWFDAEVRDVPPDIKELPPGSRAVFARFYVDAKSPIARDIDLGIAKEISIGFIPDQLTCDLCGKDAHREHQPGQQYDGKTCTLTYGGDANKVAAVEGSLVWRGCQPGAQIMGQSSPTYQWKMALAAAAQDTQGDNSMELKEALAEIDRLKAELAASGDYKKQAEAYTASLTREVLRKTKAIHFAASRDEKAAEKQSEFTGRLVKSASVADLESMNAELDEQMKAQLTPSGKAEGAGHVPGGDGDNRAPKRQPWEPRRMAG